MMIFEFAIHAYLCRYHQQTSSSPFLSQSCGAGVHTDTQADTTALGSAICYDMNPVITVGLQKMSIRLDSIGQNYQSDGYFLVNIRYEFYLHILSNKNMSFVSILDNGKYLA